MSHSTHNRLLRLSGNQLLWHWRPETVQDVHLKQHKMQIVTSVLWISESSNVHTGKYIGFISSHRQHKHRYN